MNKIIAAPATSPGIAGVSMIRVSGSGCIQQVDTIFCGETSLSEKRGYEIAYGQLYDIETHKLIDQVLVGVFRAPYSFTGEESLELWTHGSPYIVSEVMRVLCMLGISVADPGEFSMRAFLNGKIDLTQAEAIKDLTQAQTKHSHEQALARLEGKLSHKIQDLHGGILDLLALLEVAIDHAEEEVDLEDMSHRYLDLLTPLRSNVDLLLSGAHVGKMSVDGMKIALIGRPNVGKSSVLNVLVDENRAIVSKIAGTTRDVIEHRVIIKGVLIRFFDTAGIRETQDPIEKEGTMRSIQTLETADLVLCVVDQSVPAQQEDHDVFNLLAQLNKKVIVIYNKNDLEEQFNIVLPYKGIKISALKNQGVESIFDEIHQFYFSGEVYTDQDVFIANVRQENLLIQTQQHLKHTFDSLQSLESEEFVADHLRKARVCLEDIVGKTTDDTILDRIFSQFCIGK